MGLYQEQIQKLHSSLEKITMKDTNISSLHEFETFQNQLLLKRFKVNDMKYRLGPQDSRLMKGLNNATAIDDRGVHSFENNFSEVTQDLNFFFKKWM